MATTLETAGSGWTTVVSAAVTVALLLTAAASPHAAAAASPHAAAAASPHAAAAASPHAAAAASPPVVRAGEPQISEIAVRTCQPPRSSGIVSGATENEGKRRAIEAWMAKVKPLGPRYMGWGTATQRILKCVNGKSGQFDCVAVATPCTIEQAPGQPGPPGRPPLGRKRPGDPGRPIEI